MKSLKFAAAMLSMTIATAAWAEDAETTARPAVKDNPPKVLLNLSESTLSGYGAIYTRFSKAGDTTGCFAGMRGGFIINDNFVIGAGFMGLANPTDREKLSGDEYTGLYDMVEFGYGGVLAEYYFNPKDLIVFSIGTMIGGGGLYFTERNDDDDSSDNHEGGDNFFVAEPEFNVFVNITRFCRIGAGVSYRYVYGVNSGGFSDSDFSEPAASVMAQFGWF